MPVEKATASETRAIANKDIPLLARIKYIMQDIQSLEERIEWQYDRMFSVTARLSGMPGGKGMPSGFDAAFAAISELSDLHKAQLQRYTKELKKAQKILSGIESPTMRTFVTMLYVDDAPATAVREKLGMTEYGFKRARDAVEKAGSMKSVVWHERYFLVDSE